MVRRRESVGDKKRLVLAVDAGCVTCSALARRIEELVGEKLELRSLGSFQVREWRRRALGEDAPWVPTLIEVKGTEVRAWTGPAMAVYISRSLGPVTSWRVMQILGEFGSSATSERWGEHPVGVLARVVNRREFLKGAGGAVAGAAVLAGFGWVTLVSNGPSTARAQTQEQGKKYRLRPILGTERNAFVNYQYRNNERFRALWNRFRDAGHKPRPDAALAVEVTISEGGVSKEAYDLKVPFEGVGQQYPVLSGTGRNRENPDLITLVASFQRVSITDTASGAAIYGTVRRDGQVSTRHERNVLGPFPGVETVLPPSEPGCEESYGVAAQLSKYGCESGSAVPGAAVCLSFDGPIADLSDCNSVGGAGYIAHCLLGQADTTALARDFLCKYETAIRIVRGSDDYKELEERLKREAGEEATYDFDNAAFSIGGRGKFGHLTVGADYAKEAEVAYSARFLVDFNKERAKLSNGTKFAPHSREEIKMTSLTTRNLPSSYYYVYVGNDYVIDANGEKKTFDQFKADMEGISQQSQDAAQPTAQATVSAEQYQYSDEYVQCMQESYDELKEESTLCDASSVALDLLGLIPVYGIAAEITGFAVDTYCLVGSATAPSGDEVCEGY